MSLIIIIIILALVFDYINGFHDAANSIATVVSTKVLTPFQAVVWAAVFNSVAYFIFKDHAVANSISKTVEEPFITLNVILAGLLAAIFWNLLTWWFGIPSSSSHTLVGGFAGAAIAHAFITKGNLDLKTIVNTSKITEIILFIFMAPILGMAISIFITLVTIMRNTWLRLVIMLAAGALVFFIFRTYEQKKINESLAKYYKVDSYKKDYDVALEKAKTAAALQPDADKILAKLNLAKSNASASKNLVNGYRSIGADKTAEKIMLALDTTALYQSKITEGVGKYLKVESFKKQTYNDSTLKPQYEAINATYTILKDSVNKYKGNLSAMQASVAGYLKLDAAETSKLVAATNINLKSDIQKEITKADNSIPLYILLSLILFFAITYVIVEKIKTPNAYKFAAMFKKLQLVSSAAFSVGHGGNDAQKVMGIIGAALIALPATDPLHIENFKDLPTWVPIACYMAIGLGTMSGGWKIVKTMGSKITKVTPLEGVAAETSGAITLFVTEQMGIPVSTTHTITGAIIGVGATKRLSAVRWGVTISLLWAWILTIPISALVAALVYYVIHLLK
jgi:inorganic phosphate transporter, PiT family